MAGKRFVVWLQDVGREDTELVGGKGSSLGELLRAGIPVPPGFVVTVYSYLHFLERANLREFIRSILGELDYEDGQRLNEASARIKEAIESAPMPQEVAQEIREAYRALGGGIVAVRSSATAEDLPQASFAGQQRTFLNVTGEEEVLRCVQGCWSSLFEPRALFYRKEKGFDHLGVGIAVPVQRMVQSEVSGVLFTVEPVSGDIDRMVIEAVYGLGEAVVSGTLTPDLYIVDKERLRILDKKVALQEWELVRNPDPSADPEDANIRVDIPEERQSRQKLTDEQILTLAEMGKRIERHYGWPQDIEWALEGGRIYILQSRPLTALSGVREAHQELRKVTAKVLLSGSGASPGLAAGPAKVVLGVSELDRVEKGDILVTDMTTPDFVPAMKRAAAIVTDRGGRTCHAAIVSRELGIPCVVGTGRATELLRDGMAVTVDGSQGKVYEGIIEIKPTVEVITQRRLKTRTKVYVNLADPELADVVATRGPDGVGLLRAEFIIAHIGEHPKYMLKRGRGQEWSDKLARGMEKFASAFYPRPVVYRTTDFKTNEYRNLRGGEEFEEMEENPMLGYRGCSRYLMEEEAFALELAAIRKVREKYDNLYLMLPFVRTPEELAGVKRLLEENGLSRDDGLVLWMMVEVPSNVILLDKFIDVGIDGISIGSNDLTQLLLGVDRDNSRLSTLFDERNEVVLWALEKTITTSARRGITSSICGQAPSFYPDLTEKLVSWGITSVSVSPDMIDRTREIVARVERKLGKLPPQD